MQISQALRVQPKEVIAFVGGGGKTTALFNLADELVAENKHVIVTTTTRLFAAQATEHAGLVVRYTPALELAEVRQAVRAQSCVILVGEDVEDAKVAGVPPAFVDQLVALDPVDAVLVEADGARRHPFKAPAAHEPVVPAATTLLVPVVGISALGAPLDEEHAHRPEVIATLAGARPGESITPVMVARVLAHGAGGLKGKPEAARVVVLINQVETGEGVAAARVLAHLLLEYQAIDAVAIGAVRGPSTPVRETRRRTAAIVLAAGAGTRMGARVKQLLPWQGKTFIETAIERAAQSGVTETVVVLGARADEIRAVIRERPVRIVLNPDWAEGHSTSIRAGLFAVPQVDAAVFINADQPKLTSDVVNALLQRYRETDAPIVAPLYAGKRGSPVLFQRTHFAELMNLSGEQGGREVLVKYPVEYVAFDAADAGIDVDTPEDYANLEN